MKDPGHATPARTACHPSPGDTEVDPHGTSPALRTPASHVICPTCHSDGWDVPLCSPPGPRTHPPPRRPQGWTLHQPSASVCRATNLPNPSLPEQTQTWPAEAAKSQTRWDVPGVANLRDTQPWPLIRRGALPGGRRGDTAPPAAWTTAPRAHTCSDGRSSPSPPGAQLPPAHTLLLVNTGPRSQSTCDER